jgi:[ribosomal protein S18]-alanine N-acetyltransferase
MGKRILVPMERNYLSEVLEIERKSFSDPWSMGAFEIELDHPWAWFRVIGPRGEPDSLRRVDGFILCYVLPGDMHVINVAVDPSVRKQGLAVQMLRAALDTFAEKGGGVVGLEVRVSNLAAQRLYESFGFKVVGKRIGYYQKENEDALVMNCDVYPVSLELEKNGHVR